MLTKDEVRHIAQLARLGLSDEEIEQFQKELTLILDYFEELKKAEIVLEEQAKNVVKNLNVMREDKPVVGLEELSQRILLLSPQKKENYFKVKSVFKNESE